MSIPQEEQVYLFCGSQSFLHLKALCPAKIHCIRRRGNKEISIRGQLITWQHEAETLWNSFSFWAWVQREFVYLKALQSDMNTSLCATFPAVHLNRAAFKNLLSHQMSASTSVLRHWPCFRTQPSCRRCAAVPAVAWHGAAKVPGGVGWLRPSGHSGGQGGSSCRSGVIHQFSLKRKWPQHSGWDQTLKITLLF